MTRNPQLRAQDAGTSFKPFLPYWRDNIDRNLRVRGVRDNLFVQRQAPWPALPTPGNPDTTTLFDTTQLKWADECRCYRYYVLTVRNKSTGVISRPGATAVFLPWRP